MSPTRFHTTCPLDCPSACALTGETREGRLVSLRGDPDHPFTRGVICGKVSRYHEIQYGPRLSTPLIRAGDKGAGQFREASWDEALDLAADRIAATIRDHGPQAVFPYYYGGTLGILQRMAIERLTHRAGFSRLRRTICFAIAEAGWQAGVGALAIGPDGSEAEESDFIVIWGQNSASTHIHFMNFVKTARKRGATLVVVDPYRTLTARLANRHVRLRPGSDGALAAAMMSHILVQGLADRAYLARLTDFDPEVEAHLLRCTPAWAAPITGLTEEEIRQLAEGFARARAPYIRVGVGMTRQNNGAVNFHAVTCLPALVGAWGKRGGGLMLETSGAFSIRDEAVRGHALQPTPPARILDMSLLGPMLAGEMADPPVKAMLVFQANPAVSNPDASRVMAGLADPDRFLLVHEQVMTDTARFADVVLPATTFLEHEDLYKSYGQYTLQHAPPVLSPQGEARSNHETVNALAKRLGYDEPAFSLSEAETVARVLADSGLPPRGDWPGRWLDLTPSFAARHYLEGFPQPDGRFHFRPHWEEAGMPSLPGHWPVNQRDQRDLAQRYPLDLITPPAHDMLNSTFTASREARRRRGPPTVMLHPRDAEARGIRQGMQVVVESAQGRLTLVARVTEETAPGVTVIESGHLAREFPEGLPLNALTRDTPALPGGGPAFHDNRVEIRPANP